MEPNKADQVSRLSWAGDVGPNSCSRTLERPMREFHRILRHPTAEEEATALLLRKKLGREVHNFSISHGRKIRRRADLYAWALS